MKLVDCVQLVRDAVAQTMGDDYMPLLNEGGQPLSNDELAALPSQKLIDIGADVTGEEKINSLVSGLISRLGRHVIEARLYTSKLPSLYVESFDWGGFLERTRVGLGDILADPMYGKVAGTSYADIEHTYYGQDVHSKIFQEGKAIMCPISIEREELRDAFTSWDKLNAYISARQAKIKSTINLALAVMEKMLLGCAVAISDVKNGSAVHIITEAVEAGIIEQIDGHNPTLKDVERDPKFLAFLGERMKQIRGYMEEPSTAFNDGSLPTWCDTQPNLIILDDIVSKYNFYVKANTFNPEEIGLGQMDTITAWQAVKDSSSEFDIEVLSSISIDADAAGKIGQTTAYEKTGVIGLMFDPMAIGISLMRNKVTSSYTACADFWNDFNHQLVNYIIDSSYGIVAFIAD